MVLGLAALGGVGLLVPADVRWPVIAAALMALAVVSVVFVAGRRERDELAATRALGLASALVVPVTGHEDALGAITLCFTHRSGRRYDEYDVAVARELGRRAGLAVELARANEAEHRFAADVQRSLLPR